MKNTNEIVALIDFAIERIENCILINKLPANTSLTWGSIKVLNLIKTCLIDNSEIPVRVLRGLKDVCTLTAIQHEDSDFHEPIFQIYEFLELKYPHLKDLELLRMEFGKEDPI